MERVVEIGLRGGWAEFEGTPLTFPRIQLTPHRQREPPSLPDAAIATSASNTALTSESVGSDLAMS